MQTGRVSHTLKTLSSALLDTRVSEMPFTYLHGFFNLSLRNSHILKLKNTKHRNNTLYHQTFTDAISLATIQTCTSNRLVPSNGQPCNYDSFLPYLACPAWITFRVKISYSTEESTHFLSSHLLQMQTGRVSHTLKTPSCALLDTCVSEMPFYISACFLQSQSP